MTRNLHDNIGAQMIDKSLQSYFKEALRPVEVKVFSIEFTFFNSNLNDKMRGLLP